MDHRQQVESLQQTAKRTRTQTRHGTIAQVASRSTEEQHLRDLARLRRVRDRIDREYAQPLDIEALARDAHMSAGHLSRPHRSSLGKVVIAASPFVAQAFSQDLDSSLARAACRVSGPEGSVVLLRPTWIFSGKVNLLRETFPDPSLLWEQRQSIQMPGRRSVRRGVSQPRAYPLPE